MKLFNKEIDRKLFKQYPLGGSLSAQDVIVKIFNPYGRGTWYILNSDPDDPDYLWAIVDLGYGAETGSVSRSDLEGYRNKLNLGLERDLSFDPINAQKVYKGLRDGKHFDDGGHIDYDVIDPINETENARNDEAGYAKGGLVVTKIADIPNLQEEIAKKRVTYRGLGMGKLADDFYDKAGEWGTRIKVNGKEYFITQTEFDTFSRDKETGKMAIRFDAPFRQHEDGGLTNEILEMGGIFKREGDWLEERYKERDLEFRKQDIKSGMWANLSSEYGDVWHEIKKVYMPNDYYASLMIYKQEDSQSTESKTESVYLHKVRKITPVLPSNARCVYSEKGSFSERRGNLDSLAKGGNIKVHNLKSNNPTDVIDTKMVEDEDGNKFIYRNEGTEESPNWVRYNASEKKSLKNGGSTKPKTATAKKQTPNVGAERMKKAIALAKEIQEPNEKWQSAIKRAYAQIRQNP